MCVAMIQVRYGFRFRFGMDSGFGFGMDSGSHRWLSRVQLVGVDLESRLYNKEVE